MLQICYHVIIIIIIQFWETASDMVEYKQELKVIESLDIQMSLSFILFIAIAIRCLLSGLLFFMTAAAIQCQPRAETLFPV